MIASAQVAHEVRRGAMLGVHAGEPRIALGEIVARKNAIVEQWRAGQERHAAKRPTITLVRGTARFTSPHEVGVNGETFRAEHIFINTGTAPAVPPIAGLDAVHFLTNRTIMDLTTVPEHLVVLGASAVGLEFGQMFRRFGSRVTIVEAAPQIVAREDEDVAAELQRALEGEGIEFHIGAAVSRVERSVPGIRLRARAGGRDLLVDGSHLLVAAGRRPTTFDLNLQDAGVATDERGWIRVTEFLETTAPGVYALGDVTGGPAFTHISYHDYQIVFHNLFHESKRSTAGRLVPYALFTDPELGRVGMTEREARAAGRTVKVGTVPLARVARATERGDTRGMMKVVVDATSDRILGAAVLAAGGGELVQTLMALMMADAPWTTFKDAVFIHPTMTERFFALMAAVK